MRRPPGCREATRRPPRPLRARTRLHRGPGREVEAGGREGQRGEEAREGYARSVLELGQERDPGVEDAHLEALVRQPPLDLADGQPGTEELVVLGHRLQLLALERRVDVLDAPFRE